MVKVAKFFFYVIFFVGMLIFFLPKENLFYLAEKQLAQEKIYISKEVLRQKAFGLELKGASISYEGIEVANIQEADITTLLVWNKITLHDVALSSLIANYWPQKIQECEIRYTILNPLFVTAFAKGIFGEIHAEYSLKDGHVRVILHPSKVVLSKYRSSLRYFKKMKNGEYSYEKSL